jgi:S1/P1 Nuclease
LHRHIIDASFQAYVAETAYGCTRKVITVRTLSANPSVPNRTSRAIQHILAIMIRNRMRRLSTAPVLIVFASTLLHAPFACAWGNEGHRIINRLAAADLPADVPAFLHSEAAIQEIEYLGPEPDRWRSPAEAELSAVQAPEHFINLEPADALGPLPHRRLDFEAAVFASGQRPEKVGLQPWEAVEVWERLKAALREYRHLTVAHEDSRAVEQAAIFYAGWLGHYVGDASQPLHTTIQYNGWIGPNPNGYTTAHEIHWQFEGPFVGANLHASDVQPRMAPVHAIEGDVFADYVAYLRQTSKYVEKVYQLEKLGGFGGQGTQESRDFTAERLAAGASKLRDMIYSAWIRSGTPVPDPYSSGS